MSIKKTKKFVCPEITARIKNIVGPDKKEFAKKSGISYEVVRLWWNGEYLPTVEFLLKLKKLNINIDWLLTGKQEKENETCDVKCGENIRKLCKEVKDIIESGTHWGESLESNIHSFKAGLDSDNNPKKGKSVKLHGKKKVA